MLIDESYFIGERDIPNTYATDVKSVIANLIGIHEKEFLINLMGYDLYSKFKLALKNETDEQRMLDILFGKTFTGLNSQPKRWEGLISLLTAVNTIDLKVDGVTVTVTSLGVPVAETLVSPIADYCYFYWMKQKASQTAEMGEMKPQGQNAVPITPRRKMTSCWNSMVDKCLLLKEFFQVNSTVYPEYDYHVGTKECRLLLTKMNPYFS